MLYTCSSAIEPTAGLFARIGVDARRSGQRVPVLESLRGNAQGFCKFLILHPVEVSSHKCPGLRIELRIIERGFQGQIILVNARISFFDMRGGTPRMSSFVQPSSFVHTRGL